MPHYKTMMDRKQDYIFAADLGGKDKVVAIEKITDGKLTGDGGKISRKPAMHMVDSRGEPSFRDKDTNRPLAFSLNPTNCKVLTLLAGTPDTDKWSGMVVTIYPSTCMFGKDQVDCIRVRTQLPKVKKADAPSSEAGEP